MPRLHRTSPDLSLEGPLLEIRIEPPLRYQEVLQNAGLSVPSIPILALIDTGASGTLVRTSVLDRLELEPITKVFLKTASTSEPMVRLKYLVHLALSKRIAFEVEVVEAPLAGQAVQCLIGRDVLEYAVLTYNGPKNRYRLNFPEVPEDV